jgi:hypothetical protein
MSVPRSIVEQNNMVTLAADVFFVDGIVFSITVLRQIKFIMVEHVTTCAAKSLSKHM